MLQDIESAWEMHVDAIVSTGRLPTIDDWLAFRTSVLLALHNLENQALTPGEAESVEGLNCLRRSCAVRRVLERRRREAGSPNDTVRF